MVSKQLEQLRQKNEGIKTRLNKAGLHQFYETKYGQIIVQESDAVQVIIHWKGEELEVKPKFPQIGNAVQVIATIALLALVFGIGLTGIIAFAVAIVGGQVVSYAWFYSKIKQLKSDVEQALS